MARKWANFVFSLFNNLRKQIRLSGTSSAGLGIGSAAQLSGQISGFGGKMARFQQLLSPENLRVVTKPANLGSLLMQNMGYLFTWVPEDALEEDTNVPIYNVPEAVGGEMFGIITYSRQADGSIKVSILNIEHSHKGMLTHEAMKLTGK